MCIRDEKFTKKFQEAEMFTLRNPMLLTCVIFVSLNKEVRMKISHEEEWNELLIEVKRKHKTCLESLNNLRPGFGNMPSIIYIRHK
jgi:hypothetical protein